MKKINDEIKRLAVEKKIKKILYLPGAKKGSIARGMNHIAFSPSKRLRPLLVLESNLAFAEPDNDSYILAAAVELIHTYSLVHDDLPCMDDDDLRRGVKTLHVIYDEAYAVLAGDALLTEVFRVLSGYSKSGRLAEINGLFAEKCGHKGLILGQALDMKGEKKKLRIGEIMLINEKKTSSLMELALMSGAINAGADKKYLLITEKLGRLIGLMFQLQDDILDITGDPALMGKKAGRDAKKMKSSIPSIIGLERSKTMLHKMKNEAEGHIKKLPGNRAFFYDLLGFLVERAK